MSTTNSITVPESSTPSPHQSETDQIFHEFVAKLNTPQKRLFLNALRTVKDLDLHAEEFKAYMEDVFIRIKELGETGGAS